MTALPGRRTIRRYAHELYPPAKDEFEIRPLAVDVPHYYARFVGLSSWGTGWFDADPAVSMDRTIQYCYAAEAALLLDALAQGLTGDDAWRWVQEHSDAGDGFELVGERATHYLGDDIVDRIKPYPCGEATTHDHYGPRDARGFRTVSRVAGPEDECMDCTEPDPNYQIPGQQTIEETTP